MCVSAYLVFEEAVGSNDVVEDVLADVRVDGTQRVVEHVDIGVGEDGARQADALLLSARQVDALLADLGAIARRHDGQVGAERARGQHLLVEMRVESRAEHDVVLDRLVLDPGELRHVRHRSVHVDATHVQLVHLAQQARQHARLATAHRTNNLENIVIYIYIYYTQSISIFSSLLATSFPLATSKFRL